MALTPVLTHNDALPRLTLVVARGSLTLAQHDRMNVPQHNACLIAMQGPVWQPPPTSPDSFATTSTTHYERSHRLSVDMTQIMSSTAPHSATASRILQRKPRSYDLNEDFKRDARVVKERNARNFTLHGTALSRPELARVKIVSCVSYFS